MREIIEGTVAFLIVVVSAACSSSGGSASSSQRSCTIAAGTYRFDVTAHGPPACVGYSVDMTWPPTEVSGTETCTTSTIGSECQATCSAPRAPTTVYTYTVSDSGFAGSVAEPGTAGDAGVVCTYTFTARPH